MKHAARIVKRLLVYLVVASLGFVVGGSVLTITMVRRGPSLHIWHTEKLTAEFTAEKAKDDVRSFQQYLNLEDALFAQLEKQVYQHTESGPNFELARYSAGSAADPRGWNPNWNRSFELPATNPAGGVLLLHGMSDSPYSLRVLGESFSRRGYWVLGLRLPGHGTAPSGLLTATWEDMTAAVQLAMRHLASKSGTAFAAHRGVLDGGGLGAGLCPRPS